MLTAECVISAFLRKEKFISARVTGEMTASWKSPGKNNNAIFSPVKQQSVAAIKIPDAKTPGISLAYIQRLYFFLNFMTTFICARIVAGNPFCMPVVVKSYFNVIVSTSLFNEMPYV